MVCPVCNFKASDSSKFCRNCGTAFTAKQLAFTTVKQNKITATVPAGMFLLLTVLNFIPAINIILFGILSFIRNININIKNLSRAFLIIDVTAYFIIGIAVYLGFNRPELFFPAFMLTR